MRLNNLESTETQLIWHAELGKFSLYHSSHVKKNPLSVTADKCRIIPLHRVPHTCTHPDTDPLRIPISKTHQIEFIHHSMDDIASINKLVLQITE